MRSSVLSLAVLTLVAFVRTARSTPEEATVHYQRAIALYSEGSFDIALVELRRAYELAPTFKLRLSEAQICSAMKDYACAANALESYLKDGGSELPASKREVAQLELERALDHVGTLFVACPVDAAVTVDGVRLGTVKGEVGFQLNGGRRRLVVSSSDGRSREQVVELPPREVRHVACGLPLVQPPVVPRSSPSTPPWSWTLVGAMGAGTGALAVAGGVFGALALGAKNDLSRELLVAPNNGDAIASARTRAAGFALAADIGFGAAIVAGTVFLVLLVGRARWSPSSTAGTDIAISF